MPYIARFSSAAPLQKKRAVPLPNKRAIEPASSEAHRKGARLIKQRPLTALPSAAKNMTVELALFVPLPKQKCVEPTSLEAHRKRARLIEPSAVRLSKCSLKASPKCKVSSKPKCGPKRNATCPHCQAIMSSSNLAKRIRNAHGADMVQSVGRPGTWKLLKSR